MKMFDYLLGEIDDARKIAQRLIERSCAVEKAIRQRDNTLYRLLSHLHRLNRQLREEDRTTVVAALAAEYGINAPDKSKLAGLLLQLAHPSLQPKIRSKYATVLTFAGKYNKRGSLRDFVSDHGGLNGCAKAAANIGKSKKKPTNGWGKPSNHRRPR